jgi:hypothetical protein
VGRLADYAEMAARQGLVGMLWGNAAHGLNVAPWGGAARRLGTSRPRSRCHSMSHSPSVRIEPDKVYSTKSVTAPSFSAKFVTVSNAPPSRSTIRWKQVVRAPDTRTQDP